MYLGYISYIPLYFPPDRKKTEHPQILVLGREGKFCNQYFLETEGYEFQSRKEGSLVISIQFLYLTWSHVFHKHHMAS